MMVRSSAVDVVASSAAMRFSRFNILLFLKQGDTGGEFVNLGNFCQRTQHRDELGSLSRREVASSSARQRGGRCNCLPLLTLGGAAVCTLRQQFLGLVAPQPGLCQRYRWVCAKCQSLLFACEAAIQAPVLAGFSDL